MQFTVVGLDGAWKKFICAELEKAPPFENGEEGGENLVVSFLGPGSPLKPSDLLEAPTEGKRAVLFTHPGAGELGEAFLEKGISVINGGRLADNAVNSPEWVTYQAAQKRFFVAPVDHEGKRTTYVLVRTKRGIVPEWLEMENYRGLYPGVTDTEEGVCLVKAEAEARDKELEKKIDALCRSWGYVGFVFITGVHTGDEFQVETLSPFGPDAFWPAFFKGYQGNISKFFFKMENSRKLMSKLDFECTRTLKISLAPYPYHKTPWVPVEEERKFVENWLTMGAVGHQLTVLPVEEPASVIWTGVDENLISLQPELGFISATHYSEIKAAAEKIRAGMTITIQHKEVQ